MTTVSPYLQGTNLVTMNEHDLFLTNLPTFEHMQISLKIRSLPPVSTVLPTMTPWRCSMIPHTLMGQAAAFRDTFEQYCGAASS